jgi:hypothetical protein
MLARSSIATTKNVVRNNSVGYFSRDRRAHLGGGSGRFVPLAWRPVVVACHHPGLVLGELFYYKDIPLLAANVVARLVCVLVVLRAWCRDRIVLID